jgi:hypothetical protein
MGVSRTYTLEEARKAKPRALAVFQPLTTVVGLGITRIGDGYGLKVNVAEEPPAGTTLPDAVDGVPVRVEVVGQPRWR